MAASRTGSRAKVRAGGEGAGASPSAASLPIVGRVRERMNQELNARKDRASEVIQGIAGTVRRIGEPLHEESLQAIGAYADEAADRLERLASGIRNRDIGELADDVRGMARRHPASFAAAGFAAGIVVARFLRSTAPRAGGRAAAETRGARAGRPGFSAPGRARGAR